MTNTDTVDAIGTAIQVKELAMAGSNWCASPSTRPRRRNRAAHPRAARPHGHRRAADRRLPLQRPPPADRVPGLRRGAVQVPHQPRQRGQGRQEGPPVRQMIEAAARWTSRCASASTGAAWTRNCWPADGRERRRAEPWDAKQVMYEALVQSALDSAAAPRKWAWTRPDHHQLQGQRRAGPDHRLPRAGRRCDYALHLGLTEAGMGTKGTVASSTALAMLLQEGIGDTIRVSLTPQPGEARTQEVVVASRSCRPGLRSLQPQRHGLPGLRPHHQHHLPGTGQADRRLPARADAGLARALPRGGEPQGGRDGLHRQRPGREQACRHRHQPARHRRGAGAPVFIDGEKALTLRGEGIARSSIASSRATSRSASAAPLRRIERIP
jgi:(E)-4-hydroxy-3-methylbut-2-enyl-diphosphate synthase